MAEFEQNIRYKVKGGNANPERPSQICRNASIPRAAGTERRKKIK